MLTRTFCTFLALTLGCSSGVAAPKFSNGIAAIVNDAIITFQDVEQYSSQALDLINRTYRNQPSLHEQKRIEALTSGLEDLVEQQLILDDFEAAGGKLPDSIVDDEIKDRLQRSHKDRVTLVKGLQAEGTTYEAFRRRTHDDIIVRYMRERNVRQAILISPQKIQDYYATNQHRYKLGDQIKLRVIVLKRPSGRQPDEVRKLASEILQKINEGAAFTEMARIHSEGSEPGGDWGWWEETTLNRGLADAVSQLKPGQHTGVLALARDTDAYWLYQYDKAGRLAVARKYTSKDAFLEEHRFDDPARQAQTLPPPNDFYLLHVEDKRSARVKTLAEVQDDIEKELALQERARLQKRWIDRLKEKAFVRLF